MSHIIISNTLGRDVGEGADGVVLADVLERLQAGALDIEGREAAVEAPVPGDAFFRGSLGVVATEPGLGDRVFASDDLVHVFAGGVVLVQLLETVVSAEVVLALELGLCEIVLRVFADGRSLAFLGDPGELFFGLGEFSLLEEGVSGVELGFGGGVLGGLAHRLPAVGAEDQRRRRVAAAAAAGGASAGGEPAFAQTIRAIDGGADVGNFVLGWSGDEVAVVGGAPGCKRAYEGLAAGQAEREEGDDQKCGEAERGRRLAWGRNGWLDCSTSAGQAGRSRFRAVENPQASSQTPSNGRSRER